MNDLPNGSREWMAISPAEYHALDAYGSTAVKCFAVEGQLEFYARYIAKTKRRDDTDAMRMGRAFHAAMEDSGDWTSRYKLIPSSVEDDDLVPAINDALDKKSTAVRLTAGVPLNLKLPTHREYLESHRLRAAREGKDFIDAAELEVVHRQVQAVADNPACRELLSQQTGLLSEVACVYHHECGADAKALLDRVVADGFIDFKKTRFSNPFDFLRDAFKLGYDRQLGHYAMVTDRQWAALISVNDTAPFEAHAWEVPPRLLQMRRDDAERQLQHIAQLTKMSNLDDREDSQGIPLSYHNELWGSVLPLDMDQLIRKHTEAA